MVIMAYLPSPVPKPAVLHMADDADKLNGETGLQGVPPSVPGVESYYNYLFLHIISRI